MPDKPDWMWPGRDLAASPGLPIGNPLLEAYELALRRGTLATDADRLQRAYAFGIPDERALDALERCSPQGIVEMGAGTGYWARVLQERGVTVAPFDLEPAPSPRNKWFSGSDPWTNVLPVVDYAAPQFADRTLLIVWPTRDETWAAEAVQAHGLAGGQTVAFVGEPYGGRNSNDYFHAFLGDVDRCWACSVRAGNIPCVCGIRPLFALNSVTPIPQWPGRSDALYLYEAQQAATPLSAAPGTSPTSRRRTLFRRRSLKGPEQIP